MANEGMNELARVLDGRAKGLGDKPPVLDFGTIQGDMGLLTNKFPKPIPYDDYAICRSVCYDPGVPLTVTEDEEHEVRLPEKMARIKPGDRVLVAWAGDDAVVIDIVMQAPDML